MSAPKMKELMDKSLNALYTRVQFNAFTHAHNEKR